MVRPDWFGYGGLIRSSLLTARAFYEWLTSWPQIRDDANCRGAYRLIGLTAGPPDTNIVNFVACPGSETSLRSLNEMTDALYHHFSIDSEGGSDTYSYGQPFFLSRTHLDRDQYPASVLTSFFERAGIADPSEYDATNIIILRATLMSPYIDPLRELGAQGVLRDFFAELHLAAMTHLNAQPAPSR